MIDFKRLESQYYTEPYKPYIATGICHKCLKEGNYENIRQGSEGKEVGIKLYVRLTCPNNPDHNGEWMRHGKRPLKFRIKKMLKRLKVK